MKHNIIYLTFMAMLLTVACAKEELQDGVQPRPENAVSFSGSMTLPQDAAAAPDTRTSYADGENAVSAEWEAEDRIGLFCETGGELVAANFGYRNTTAGKQAVFDYILPGEVVCWSGEAAAGHDFYAYYPYAESEDGSPADPERVPVQLPAVQNFDSLDPLGELSDLDFMYASALGQTQEQVGEEGMVNLDFQHLFSILQVKITTTRFATVDAIIFRCTEEDEPVSYGDGTSVNLRTGEISPANTSNEIRLEGSLNTMISNYVTFNMLVSPGHEGKTFEIVAEINGNKYPAVTKAAPEGGFKAGRTYVVTVDALEVKAEDAEPMIDLSEDGTANCYYVTEPGTLYRFRADIKGNGVDPAGGDVNIVPKSALVLWYTCFQTTNSPWLQESPVVIGSLGLEPDGYIYFRTPETFVNGNVVVIAIDEDFDYSEIQAQDRQITNANVLWSWNLVVTEGYDPNSVSSQFTKGGYTFMTRDLGAIIDPEQALIGGTWNRTALAAAIGNCYQWGRKDPFPSLPDVITYLANYVTHLHFTPAYTPIPALDLGTFGVKSAHHQILGDDEKTICMNVPADLTTPEARIGLLTENPHIWMTLPGGGYLVPDDAGKAVWGNPENSGIGVKTMYDPCPPGWKVMSRDAWLALTDNLSNTVAKTDGIDGILVDDMYYFPVTGGLWRNDKGFVNGYAASCGIPADSGYWFDGSYTDNKYGNFRTATGFAAEGGDRSVTCSTLQTAYGTNGASVRCIKIDPGTAVPGGQLDNFDKKDW